MDSDAVKFAFEYRPGECYRASRSYHRLSRRLPVWPVWCLGLALVLLKLDDIRRGVAYTTFEIAALSIAGGLAFLVFGLVPLLTFYVAYRMPKRDPALAAPRERTLTDRGLALRSTGVKAEMEWSVIRRAMETDEFFLLVPQGSQVLYLPKRALANEGEVSAARAILASQLGDRFKSLTAR
ncbi:MAG: hypothetical protein NVS1B4_26900 [Gemmatimonadaceae bacterium]